MAIRCAYCHGDLVRAMPTCRCGTLLHEECAAEMETCPTLGCGKPIPAPSKGRPWRPRVLVAILVTILVVAAIRERPRTAVELDGIVVGRRWVREVTLITPVPRAQVASGREVVIWTAAPGDTRAAERWQVSRVLRSSGSGEAFWPEVVLGQDERELDRSSRFEVEVHVPERNESRTFANDIEVGERVRVIEATKGTMLERRVRSAAK